MVKTPLRLGSTPPVAVLSLRRRSLAAASLSGIRLLVHSLLVWILFKSSRLRAHIACFFFL